MQMMIQIVHKQFRLGHGDNLLEILFVDIAIVFEIPKMEHLKRKKKKRSICVRKQVRLSERLNLK